MIPSAWWEAHLDVKVCGEEGEELEHPAGVLALQEEVNPTSHQSPDRVIRAAQQAPAKLTCP